MPAVYLLIITLGRNCMAYVFHRREPEDKNTVVIREQWQITYWMLSLHTTQDKLIKALKAVGADVEEVKRYLLQ